MKNKDILQTGKHFLIKIKGSLKEIELLESAGRYFNVQDTVGEPFWIDSKKIKIIKKIVRKKDNEKDPIGFK